MTTEPPVWSAPSAPGAGGPPAAGATPAGWGASGAPAGWGGTGWSAGPPRPPDVRPGVVPLRPLGIGEIIDGAISTMRRHWKLQLGLSAIVVTAVSVLQAGALFLLYRNTAGVEAGELTGPDAEAGVAANAAQVVTALIGQLAQMVLLGILVFVVSRAVLGQDVTLHQAWLAVRPQLWRLIGLSVLIMVLVVAVVTVPVLVVIAVAVSGTPLAATITLAVASIGAGVCAAVWLWVRLGLSAPALVLERLTVRAAMARSARLVRRSWWRVFGVLVLAAVVASILGGIIQTPFLAAAFFDYDFDGVEAPGVWFYVFTTLGAVVSGTITYPFSAGVSALLYLDLRMRREALDLTLVRSARAAQAVAGRSTSPGSGPWS